MTDLTYDFIGKTTFVTGGSASIGEATAKGQSALTITCDDGDEVRQRRDHVLRSVDSADETRRRAAATGIPLPSRETGRDHGSRTRKWTLCEQTERTAFG